VTSQRSVSVIAPTCMAADAGATVVFGTPRSRAEAILETHGARIAHSI
jgi:thiamine biosynthesis lipoprotein ApbE